MNTAQRLLASWVGMEPHPEASLAIAVEQTRSMLGKSPTPKKPRHPRKSRNRFIFMKSKDANVEVKPRLFKGHRP